MDTQFINFINFMDTHTLNYSREANIFLNWLRHPTDVDR